MIYNEEKLIKVNKIIKDMIFEYNGPITLDFNSSFLYRFKIIGTKKMISVGDYYDYLKIDVKIVDGDKNFSIYCNIFSTSVLKSYVLNHSLINQISDELQYFFGSEKVRVDLNSFELSDEYELKTKDVKL